MAKFLLKWLGYFLLESIVIVVWHFLQIEVLTLALKVIDYTEVFMLELWLTAGNVRIFWELFDVRFLTELKYDVLHIVDLYVYIEIVFELRHSLRIKPAVILLEFFVSILECLITFRLLFEVFFDLAVNIDILDVNHAKKADVHYTDSHIGAYDIAIIIE